MIVEKKPTTFNSHSYTDNNIGVVISFFMPFFKLSISRTRTSKFLIHLLVFVLFCFVVINKSDVSIVSRLKRYCWHGKINKEITNDVYWHFSTSVTKC